VIALDSPMSQTRSVSQARPVPATLSWIGECDGFLRLIDQTRLPGDLRFLDCETVEQVFEAIRSLRVRGAPAIGVAAAYGVVIGLQRSTELDSKAIRERFDDVSEFLAKSRPTAVNLFWALDRMRAVVESSPDASSGDLVARLLQEARNIEREDQETCAAIGRIGADLLADKAGVLTHCNAGSLATAGDGTALSVIFAAAAQGKALDVYADETRPLLQGARLTAWELQQRGIPVTVICDSAAGWVMQEGRIQAVITGADRIAANGDAANKIGTYGVAILAKAHKIPFYVAAPSSTFDVSLESGASIPIEVRDAAEITAGFGQPTAPEGVAAYNPAFDVTPAEYIAAIVTERGLIQPVTSRTVREVLGR
jgi:methylthioribose-1-phosphate isomerase